MPQKIAFFDLDGTLVSSNVVHQYLWFARASGELSRRLKLYCDLPRLGWLELRSRRRFNEAFFRHYAGFHRQWLLENSPRMVEQLLLPALYPGAIPLLEKNRRDGFYTVLLTGSLDFAIAPLARFLSFDRVVSNRLQFAGDIATGALEPPILAETEKGRIVRALLEELDSSPAHCRAYSDSLSDLPMLEAVGNPTAVNPSARLRRTAANRSWRILDLTKPA